MKTTLRLVASCLSAAALLVAAPALANDDHTSSTDTVDQQSGTIGNTDNSMGDQAGKEGMAGTMPPAASDTAIKTDLNPHVVVIESSLESAKDQLAGLRSQYEISDSKRPMTQIRVHSRELRGDLKVAMEHQSQLQNGAKKYPEVAQSGEFRSINSSLSEVNKTAQSWESKSKANAYWNNKDQVKQDLDNFEKQLDSAISNAKSFESKSFDAGTPTG
jgi:hypothetical protein